MVKAVKMITTPRPEIRGRSFSSDIEKNQDMFQVIPAGKIVIGHFEEILEMSLCCQ